MNSLEENNLLNEQDELRHENSQIQLLSSFHKHYNNLSDKLREFENSENSRLLHSLIASMSIINQQKENQRMIKEQASKSYSKEQFIKQSNSSDTSSKDYNLRNHLKLTHKQTALILCQNKKDQIKSLIQNRMLHLKLKELKNQQSNNHSLSIQKDNQLQGLCYQDEQNKYLHYKYLSEKYRNLCIINKGILQNLRRTHYQQKQE